MGLRCTAAKTGVLLCEPFSLLAVLAVTDVARELPPYLALGRLFVAWSKARLSTLCYGG